MNIQKWKRAVIHLECATDSEHFRDRINRITELTTSLREGKISHEEFSKQITGKSRDVRFHGTAIFYKQSNKHYLITAKHVVWDELSAEREFEEEIKRFSTWPQPTQDDLLQSGIDRASNTIFNIIFRVPSIDELLAGKTNQAFLMNLGAGASSTVPYTFSSPDRDLAIISLSQRASRFVEDLISNGYEPITEIDLGSEPNQEGEDVYTVGFPAATSVLGQLPKDQTELNWSSSYFSLPVYSFGKVSMNSPHLDFFWTDMSIYPGNSGGPVILDDKLIGIVSAQATIGIENSKENLQTRIPFGKIIKAKLINEIIAIQNQKDSWLDRSA